VVQVPIRRTPPPPSSAPSPGAARHPHCADEARGVGREKFKRGWGFSVSLAPSRIGSRPGAPSRPPARVFLGGDLPCAQQPQSVTTDARRYSRPGWHQLLHQVVGRYAGASHLPV
jgi:hypothetical protein